MSYSTAPVANKKSSIPSVLRREMHTALKRLIWAASAWLAPQASKQALTYQNRLLILDGSTLVVY